jgi:hypothetical protein
MKSFIRFFLILTEHESMSKSPKVKKSTEEDKTIKQIRGLLPEGNAIAFQRKGVKYDPYRTYGLAYATSKTQGWIFLKGSFPYVYGAYRTLQDLRDFELPEYTPPEDESEGWLNTVFFELDSSGKPVMVFEAIKLHGALIGHGMCIDLVDRKPPTVVLRDLCAIEKDLPMDEFPFE